MTRKGPNRLKLETYVRNADPAGIDAMSAGLVDYMRALRSASGELTTAARLVADHLSGQTAEAAAPRFQHSSSTMMDRAQTIGPAPTSLTTASAAFQKAIDGLGSMKDVPDDPAPVDPTTRFTPAGEKQAAANQSTANQNQAAYDAQETQAAQLTQQMDTDNASAVAELKKIHGIPDDPAPAGNVGSPQGPSGGADTFNGPTATSGYDAGSPNAGSGGPGPRHPGTVNPGPTKTGPPRHPGPSYPGPGDPGPTGPQHDQVHTGPGSGVRDPSPVRGIAPQGPGVRNPFTGATTTGSGNTGASGTGGGLSGPATAGLLGGAGLGLGGVGGLIGKSLANRGYSVPGLSGTAGKIGASSRTGSSAVTGRTGGAAGAGGRAGAAAGAGAGRAGAGRAGAGAGAGRAGAGAGRSGGGRAGAGAGTSGKAGGRGGAGGTGGRGGKKDRRKGDVWDGVEDGEQWIDDEGAGERVID